MEDNGAAEIVRPLPCPHCGAEAELKRSARYILEDANPEKLAEACGLPLGVIVAALENILPNAESIHHEGEKNL